MFTYGTKEYSDLIIDQLLPNLKSTHRFSRKSCQYTDGVLYKDLKLTKKNLKNVILVDDSYSALVTNPGNCIHVPSWVGSPYDRYLEKAVIPILKRCLIVDDVHSILPTNKSLI